MKDFLYEITRRSLVSSPEDLLRVSLDTCISLAGATGGSILGEEGPYLQFLFANVPELIGKRVPFDSIAGVTARESRFIYTFAPKDARHFEGIDAHLKKATSYLLSIPIPKVVSSQARAHARRSGGVLQLLFDEDIFHLSGKEPLPKEFAQDELGRQEGFDERFGNVILLLPIIQFGMEVMTLRRTSYQVIHELKNKLIGAESWLNYLRDDVEAAHAGIVQGQVKDDLGLAQSTIREGAELAKSYLQFTKVYEPRFRSANVNTVLQEVSASARALGPTLGTPVEVALEMDLAVPAKSLDAGLLKMAFFNLCKNAVEALVSSGTPGPRVTVRSAWTGERVEVRVADNGPGMPQEIADSLFIPFKTKKEGGTGLGLTITKKIVDVHDGDIRCETGEKGTTFVVTL